MNLFEMITNKREFPTALKNCNITTNLEREGKSEGVQ
jgi:hypothetical protein